MPPPDQFRYDGFAIDPARSVVTCRYATGAHSFTERFTFGTGGDWDDPAVRAAVRLLYLLAGVSYYKTTAAPLIELDEPTTPEERGFLADYYLGGLAEFAYRNGLDLRGLRVSGPEAARRAPAPYDPEPGRPLIPFGGGIDSIVTVESISADHPRAALCIVAPPGDRFAAIEEAASATGLPVTRIAREIDPLVRRSDELGFLNGHVPVTAVITAAAVVAAVLERRDAVVLSNEWSASVPTLVDDGPRREPPMVQGRRVRTQLRRPRARHAGPRPLGLLLPPPAHRAVGVRAVRRASPGTTGRFAAATAPSTRTRRGASTTGAAGATSAASSTSCSRPSWRAPTWPSCSPATSLSRTPPTRIGSARCSGWVPTPSRSSASVTPTSAGPPCCSTAQREDRAGSAVLHRLCADLATASPPATGADVATLLAPRGTHRIPDRYAPADLLVRAR